ncbi:hypothetical protein CO2235_150197 [Cupriavidus oxalaticus]|uniref:Uncharacterized protein n=1 Tax=Cupriavidus oxalaticus TaxID=96344 RepID=A0A375FLW7_9BURK|nr:hypothetical protein CO2235_U590052 [Cupriavidus oxalaticus]SPC12542.1 hypothetical protein CO2235_150197 [Cupriavidus oxalaticus]
MRVICSNDRRLIGRPVFSGTLDAHRTTGERERNLNCVMRMETGLLFRMTDPDASAAPEHDPSGSEKLWTASASSVGHRFTLRADPGVDGSRDAGCGLGTTEGQSRLRMAAPKRRRIP